jgi:hypothetical protein
MQNIGQTTAVQFGNALDPRGRANQACVRSRSRKPGGNSSGKRSISMEFLKYLYINNWPHPFEESTLDQALYLINDRTTPLVLIAFKYLKIGGQSMIYVEPVLGSIPTQGEMAATTSEVQPDDGYAAWLLPAIGEKLGEIRKPKVGHSVTASVTFNSAE